VRPALWIALLLALGACETTSGRRVRLRTEVTSDLTPDRTFTTGLGWTVTLTRARLATGPLYYFEGDPAIARRFVLIRAAHAHPGHYAAGAVQGQMLQAYSVDLLAGTAPYPEGAGVSGPMRSAAFTFQQPSAGPVAAALEGHVAEVQGQASRDGQVIHFAFRVALADVARTARDGQVMGCRFDPTDVQGDGTVTLQVRPRVWFNLVDFSTVPPGTPDTPSLVPAGSLAHLAFSLGLGQLSAFQFSYRKDTP
jgi:hypothetical protein